MHATLAFPSHWMAPLNPARKKAAEHATAWLRRMGALEDRGARKRLAALNLPLFGGAPFPYASTETLDLAMRFAALATLHDDEAERTGVSWADEVALALESHLASDRGRFLPAWADLGRAWRGRMSPRWCCRHAEHMHRWLATVEEEVHVRRSPVTLDEHMALRAVTAGMLPTLDLLEVVLGFELLAQHHEHLLHRELVSIACRLVAWTNDLASVEADDAKGLPNAVALLARERNVSLRRAARLAEDECCALVAEFDRLEPDAEVLGAPHPAWRRAARHAVYGFAAWHAAADRYRKTGAALALTVAEAAE